MNTKIGIENGDASKYGAIILNNNLWSKVSGELRVEVDIRKADSSRFTFNISNPTKSAKKVLERTKRDGGLLSLRDSRS